MALSNPFKGKSTEEIASIFDRVYKNTWQQPADRQDNLTAEDISKGVVVSDYLRDLQATPETFGGEENKPDEGEASKMGFSARSGMTNVGAEPWKKLEDDFKRNLVEFHGRGKGDEGGIGLGQTLTGEGGYDNWDDYVDRAAAAVRGKLPAEPPPPTQEATQLTSLNEQYKRIQDRINGVYGPDGMELAEGDPDDINGDGQLSPADLNTLGQQIRDLEGVVTQQEQEAQQPVDDGTPTYSAGQWLDYLWGTEPYHGNDWFNVGVPQPNAGDPHSIIVAPDENFEGQFQQFVAENYPALAEIMVPEGSQREFGGKYGTAVREFEFGQGSLGWQAGTDPGRNRILFSTLPDNPAFQNLFIGQVGEQIRQEAANVVNAFKDPGMGTILNSLKPFGMTDEIINSIQNLDPGSAGLALTKENADRIMTYIYSMEGLYGEGYWGSRDASQLMYDMSPMLTAVIPIPRTTLHFLQLQEGTDPNNMENWKPVSWTTSVINLPLTNIQNAIVERTTANPQDLQQFVDFFKDMYGEGDPLALQRNAQMAEWEQYIPEIPEGYTGIEDEVNLYNPDAQQWYSGSSTWAPEIGEGGWTDTPPEFSYEERDPYTGEISTKFMPGEEDVVEPVTEPEETDTTGTETGTETETTPTDTTDSDAYTGETSDDAAGAAEDTGQQGQQDDIYHPEGSSFITSGVAESVQGSEQATQIEDIMDQADNDPLLQDETQNEEVQESLDTGRIWTIKDYLDGSYERWRRSQTDFKLKYGWTTSDINITNYFEYDHYWNHIRRANSDFIKPSDILMEKIREYDARYAEITSIAQANGLTYEQTYPLLKKLYDNFNNTINNGTYDDWRRYMPGTQNMNRKYDPGMIDYSKWKPQLGINPGTRSYEEQEERRQRILADMEKAQAEGDESRLRSLEMQLNNIRITQGSSKGAVGEFIPEDWWARILVGQAYAPQEWIQRMLGWEKGNEARSWQVKMKNSKDWERRDPTAFKNQMYGKWRNKKERRWTPASMQEIARKFGLWTPGRGWRKDVAEILGIGRFEENRYDLKTVLNASAGELHDMALNYKPATFRYAMPGHRHGLTGEPTKFETYRMIDGPGYGWYHPKQGLVFHSEDDYRYNIGREGGVMISNGVITPLTGGPPFNLNKVRQGKTDWDKNLGWHFEGMAKRMTPDPHKNVNVRNLNMNTIADALMGANYADSWIHEEFRAMGIKPFGHLPVEGMVIPVKGDKNHMYEIKVGSTAWKMLQAGYGIKDIVNQIKPTERYFSAWREFRAPHQERLAADRARARAAAQEVAAAKAAERRAAAREQEILAMNSKLQQWALKKWKSYAKKRGYSSSAIGNFQRSGQWWNMFASNKVFKQDLQNYLKKLGFTWADLRPPNVNFEGGRGTLHGQGIRAN